MLPCGRTAPAGVGRSVYAAVASSSPRRCCPCCCSKLDHLFAPPLRQGIPNALADRVTGLNATAEPRRSSDAGIPSCTNYFSISCRHSGLVMRSAVLSTPLTFFIRKRPFFRASWLHNSCTSMCRTFPSPLRCIMHIAAEASISTTTSAFIPRSAARLCRPSPSLAALFAAYSSASPELSAMGVWSFDQVFSKYPPPYTRLLL